MRLNWVEPILGWVGVYPVLQEEFERVMGVNPSTFQGPRRPVEYVTWHAAREFCARLTEQEDTEGQLPIGYRYTLPTDLQWSIFAADASLANAITGLEKRRTGTCEVGTLGANLYGLHDVRGNVWEWCADSGEESQRLRKRPATDRRPQSAAKILRGGCWYDYRPEFLELNGCIYFAPDGCDSYYGFRCVLVE